MRHALIPLVLLLAACQSSTANRDSLINADLPPSATPWTGLSAKDSAEDFHFVVVTDRTGGHRPGVFSGAMPKVNLLAPAFVVSVGDLIEGYTENQAQIDREWDEMEGFISQLEAPFFYTAGNHDMNNAVMAETWQRRFGPSFYHFTYKDVLFVVLNSELFGMVGAPDTPLPGPWRQQDQMAFIEQVLAENETARWTIVLLHQPLWDTREVDEDWRRVEDLLGDRDYTVFAGHFHQYTKHRRHDRNYVTLATTGGGSGLRGPVFGEFDHVAWITMTSEGPRIANVMLDGIYDEDVSNRVLQAQVEALIGSVAVTPMVSEAEVFSSDVQNVQINNPTDGSMSVSPSIALPGNFEIRGLQPVTLAAGESKNLELQLSSATPIPYRDLVPGLINWTVTADIDGRPVQVVAQSAALPVTRNVIPYVSAAPAIDGNLDDWDALSYVVDRQGDVLAPAIDPNDASYRFDVAYDDSALYVAVEVTDDELVHLPNAIAREQDAITVIIDPRPEPMRNRSMGVGEAVMQDMPEMAMMMLPLAPAGDDTLMGYMEETAAVTEHVIKRTATGYVAEFALPMRFLDVKAGTDTWTETRIVVSVYDRDEGDHGTQYLQWHPYRYGAAALPWSHTFVKSSRD